MSAIHKGGPREALPCVIMAVSTILSLSIVSNRPLPYPTEPQRLGPHQTQLPSHPPRLRPPTSHPSHHPLHWWLVPVARWQRCGWVALPSALPPPTGQGRGGAANEAGWGPAMGVRGGVGGGRQRQPYRTEPQHAWSC